MPRRVPDFVYFVQCEAGLDQETSYADISRIGHGLDHCPKFSVMSIRTATRLPSFCGRRG